VRKAAQRIAGRRLGERPLDLVAEAPLASSATAVISASRVSKMPERGAGRDAGPPRRLADRDLFGAAFFGELQRGVDQGAPEIAVMDRASARRFLTP